MKTKIKRISKRTLATILGVLMLLMSIGLGTLITAGATTYYLWRSTNNAFNNDGGVQQQTMSGSSSPWTYTWTGLSGSTNYYFRISTSNSSSTTGNQVTSSNVTFNGDNISSSENSDYGGERLFRVNLKAAGSVTVTYDGTNITVTSGNTSGGGSITTYYYRGSKNSWGATPMTDGGTFAYYETDGTTQFKIAKSSSTWDFGSSSDINNSLGDVTVDTADNNLRVQQACYICIDYSTEKIYATSDDPTSAGAKVTDSDLLAVLGGTKIMFYGGELTSWGSHDFKLNNSINGTSVGNVTITNEYEFRKFCVAQTSYVMGHWNSGMSTTPYAGKAYVVRDYTNASTHTQKANSGSNYIYEISNGETTSVTTTISSSIPHGSQLSVTTGSAGNSVLGLSNTIEYYIYDGTNYYKYELDNGALDTNELAIKNGYVLKTVLKDTNGLYVVADSDIFNIEASYAVTFSAGTGGTISPSGSQQVGTTTPTAVTATANAGYQFSSWTKSNVTLTSDTAVGDGRTANVTASAAGSLIANFTKKSYTLTHGSKTNGTFTTSVDSSTVSSGSSVEFEKTVTVNCTPNTGYKVSTVTYTPSGGSATTATGSGNTWTFSMPAANTTVNVTFAKKDNTITKTASPSGGGTVDVYSDATGSTTKDNYQIEDTIYLRATPNAAYNFTKFTVSYADGKTQDITASSATKNGSYYYYGLAMDASHFNTSTNDGSITVTGYFTAKPTYEVAAQTNNAIYGTVSVSDATAYEGKEITVTTSEKSGTLSEVKITKTSDGSDVTSSVSYNSSTKKFTMPAYAVTVKATFTAYSGDSNFYYNGYDSSANEMTGTYYGQQMTKAMLDGETFSYYHVTGRTETNQLFTVSYGDPTSNGTVFFTSPTTWNDQHGWSGDVQAQFFSSDSVQLKDWAWMTYDKTDSYGKVWKMSVPYGARYVQFRTQVNDPSTSNWPYTAICDLNDLTNNDCFYIKSYSSSGNQTDIGTRNIGNQSRVIASGFWENFNGTSKYTSNFSTSGFYSHNANHTGSHAYNKPKGLGDNKGDYYVIVLYNGKTYTINGVTRTVSLDPEIIWMADLPEGVEDKVPVYAKDGAVSNKTSTTASDLSIGQQIADTAISGAGLSGLTTETYYQKAKADVGSEITITTTIKNTTKAVSSTESENLRDLYYVKAFSINGMCYSLNEWNSSGVYTTKYTVQPTDTYVEITPIFFLKDSSNCTTFYLDGYTDEIKNSGWGETLYVYPFYTDPDVSDDDVSGGNNAFGKYPGQPVINYGGKYYTQVPMSYYTTDEKSHTKECTVEGVVISNGYSDIVHSTDLGKYNGVTSHKQTYDFKDFYTIKVALNPDRIIYTFKYRSGEENNNPSPSSKESRSSVTSSLYASKSSYTGTHSSEFLKDTHGRYVDIFGKVLSTQPDSEPSSGYLSVYSVGYVQNASGNYATEWVVYDTSGNIIKYSDSDKSILPAALYFSSSSQLSTYGLSDYVNMYNKLNDSSYTDKPVKICYEQEIEIDSAKRSDGVWLHSSDNDVISANIKIQYMASGSSTYVDDSMSYDSASGTSSGSTTGAKAYFTNTDTNKAGNTYNGNYQTGDLYSSSSKSFTFTAESNGNYIFQGWYRVNTAGTESLVTTENDGSSDMTSSDTYIARFKYVTSGALNLSASMTSAYTGLGTAKIGVDVLNSSDEVKKTYELGTSAITVPSTYIKSDSTYKLRVTLQTVASGDYRFNAFSSTAAATFFGGTDSKSTTNYTNDTGTRTFTFNVSDLYTDTTQNVLSLAYTSTLDKGTAYTVEYNYTGLGGASKTYTTKAYSFETITNGTNVTELTVGNRGTTFQEWVTNHVPAVDNKDYDQTWTIGTLTYTNNKISLTADSNARTFSVTEDIDGVTSTATGLAKDAYSSGTRTLTCTEALKSEFKYWSVHNLTKTGTKGNIEMARCYSYDFTLQLTGDSYISLETTSDDENPALLSDPVYSREIYTDGESTVDKVYVDFILAYMNKEISLKEDELGSNTYRSGIIVEFNENTTVSSAYNGETFISDNDQVRSFAGGNAANSIYNAEGQSGRNAMVRFTANDSNYNNFNRLDYRLGFNNNTSWMTRVMKAYYYVTDGTNVYLSDPVYFCLYDTSVAVYEQ